MHDNLSLAEDYYTALGQKKPALIEKDLHPAVQFVGPMDERKGKEGVFQAIKNFADALTSLHIRAQFGSGDQAVIIYDVEFPAPIGKIRGASLMTFQDGLITRIELFYDAVPMQKLKRQIFAQ